MRTMGIEEELLVVDASSGHPLSVSTLVLPKAQGLAEQQEQAGRIASDDPGGHVTAELQQQQLETDTPPRRTLAELDQDLHEWRDLANRAAGELDARIVASGTSPMPVTPRLSPGSRYARMVERFGITAREQLTCGCHIHVSVESAEEAVGVLDRIRGWLPVLLAISANSPFWQGGDTGYASFRSQAWVRWPSAGPTGVFGSAAAYRRLVSDMVASGVLLDEDMVYFDARLSRHYPTVEIRAADVCLDAHDAVLLAGLCRAMVDTAAEEWRSGTPPPDVPTAMLRLATWQAAREGVDGRLLHPVTGRPAPARQVLDRLVDRVRPALEASGDLALVESRLDQVLERGNGARRQRAVLSCRGSMADVVADLARGTAGIEG